MSRRVGHSASQGTSEYRPNPELLLRLLALRHIGEFAHLHDDLASGRNERVVSVGVGRVAMHLTVGAEPPTRHLPCHAFNVL